jgi:hypothetical protein
MFEIHSFTKNKYFIHYITNYENLNKNKIDDSHISLLSNCDIFMYQPLNQEYIESEYDITNITKYLNDNTIILKINYYRFRGFWYNSEYKPYTNYNNYKFLNMNYYGIHDSFINFNTTNKNDIIDKINNIKISRDELLLFFDNELTKFKIIDDNSDVDMFNYFINNYQTKKLFHDPFHPTNLFFYEMFRQIIIKLDNCELKYEDYNFINLFTNIAMTHWALPILPIVKNILGLKMNDNIFIFHPPDNGDMKLYMDIYDYYYIRLSHDNFKNYLANLNNMRFKYKRLKNF